MRTPRRKTMVSRNGTSPKHTGRNWNAACDQTLTSFSISLSYAYCLFETSVREAALAAIPQSKKSLKIAVPWWNKQYDVAVKRKKYSFNRMKRTWLLSDFIIFKRCRARARRVILEAKSFSWRQFCTSLTSNTNLKSLEGNQKLLRSPLQLFHPNVARPRHFCQK